MSSEARSMEEGQKIATLGIKRAHTFGIGSSLPFSYLQHIKSGERQSLTATNGINYWNMCLIQCETKVNFDVHMEFI